MPKSILTICSLLIMISSLNGCATLKNDESITRYDFSKDKTAIGQYADDAMITSKVKTRYLKDLYLKSFGISVSTVYGVVSLIGNLPNNQLRQRAIELAWQTKGVTEVDANNLSIPAMALQPTAINKRKLIK